MQETEELFCRISNSFKILEKRPERDEKAYNVYTKIYKRIY